MTETSFTPGPWTVEEEIDHPKGHHAETYHRISATSDGKAPVDREWVIQSRANAHLISAAPDLHEAAAYATPILALIDRHLSGKMGEADFIDAIIDHHDPKQFEKAKAALAKSRGEKQ